MQRLRHDADDGDTTRNIGKTKPQQHDATSVNNNTSSCASNVVIMQNNNNTAKLAEFNNNNNCNQWNLFRFSTPLFLPQVVAHAASTRFNYASNKFWRLTSQIAARYGDMQMASPRRGLNSISDTMTTTSASVLTRDLSLPACNDASGSAIQQQQHRRRMLRRRRRQTRSNSGASQILLQQQHDDVLESGEEGDASAAESTSGSADMHPSDDGGDDSHKTASTIHQLALQLPPPPPLVVSSSTPSNLPLLPAAAAISSSVTNSSITTSTWPMTMPCRVCMQDFVIASPKMARRQLGLVRPCRCTGTVAWVHNACLASWVFMDNVGNGGGAAAHPRCELCSTRYAYRLRRRPLRQWAASLVSHGAVFWAISLATLPLPTLNFLCNVHALRFGKFLSICDSTDFNELKWCAASLAGMVMFWCAGDYCRLLETTCRRGGGGSASTTTSAGLFVYMSVCVLCLSSNDLRRTWRKWRSAQYEVDFDDFNTPTTLGNGGVDDADASSALKLS